MKVYRYMSIEEFVKMSHDMDIIGKPEFACRTNSTGVCFLPETIVDNYGDTYTPVQAYEFLGGVVSKDVLVEFETSAVFEETWGAYFDPMCREGYDSTITIGELCIPEYNRDTCVPTRYTIPNWEVRNIWQWYNFN